MLNLFRSRPRPQRQMLGLLPPLDNSPRPRTHHSRLSRRYSRLLIVILCTLTLLGIYSNLDLESESWLLSLARNLSSTDPQLPPLYPEYRLKELALPQHNPDLPYPEGRNGKYLWISEHVHGELYSLFHLARDIYGLWPWGEYSFGLGKCIAGALRKCVISL
jgi:hypothetical protein